ncbi:phage integrase N-terminal SAM-like domain-containing protein [Roseiflexus castenholzii]|uniref:phage integrase N-terminal SAM-like domain-containing protein n=1 Tax=Roseiflexus castenholzii TaxID=120962 RepID=UPI003C7BB0AC
MRAAVRLSHSSIRTEESQMPRVTEYMLFPEKRHPNGMDVANVEAFLRHLAVAGHRARQRPRRIQTDG